MAVLKKTLWLVGVAGIVLTVGGLFLLSNGWWLPAAERSGDEDHPPAHHEQTRVKLSPQARGNLRLNIRPVALEAFTQTVAVPGMIVEHQGKSEHGVSAPLAGVVRHVAATQGTTVRPGEELVTLHLVSETLQSAQADLYKTARELQITQDEKQRLEQFTGVVPGNRVLELDYQKRRLKAALEALQFSLASRGLTAEQIQQAGEGKFVTELVIRAPDPCAGGHQVAGSQTAPTSPSEQPVFEVEELKVHLGEYVQAGQIICSLANHQSLYIEGRAFKEEVPLIERAAAQGWPIEAEFSETGATHWPALAGPLKLRFLGNRIDPATQTLPFYLTLPNSCREHVQAGKTYRTWRFHPGQRVRLHVPVERWEGIFVLPAEAVVREGAEAYVFRANGDILDRTPVHVLYEDRRHVVLANDGSILAGHHIAHNAAAQLNRVLKSQSAGDEGGHHHHHH